MACVLDGVAKRVFLTSDTDGILTTTLVVAFFHPAGKLGKFCDVLA